MVQGQSVSLDASGRFRQSVAAQLAQHGYGKPGSIPEDMTFLAWYEDLVAKGLKVDAHPFTLEDRPSLLPLYRDGGAINRWAVCRR